MTDIPTSLAMATAVAPEWPRKAGPLVELTASLIHQAFQDFMANGGAVAESVQVVVTITNNRSAVGSATSGQLPLPPPG